MLKLTPTEQKYIEFDTEARAILASSTDPKVLDEAFYKRGTELAVHGSLGALGAEVVKYALDQALLQKDSGHLEVELATFQLASISHAGEEMLKNTHP